MMLDKAARQGSITLYIMMATVMQSLDTTIANVALPHIQGALNATQEQITWVLTSYIVAAAIMTAPTGFLSARMGRKKLFLMSIAGFTLASVLCGASVNLTQIVIFRLLQGVFGAGLVPLSQAILLDANPPEKHGQAMALWGAGVMLGPILGPTLGGWITEYYNWRWVFYINLPLGIATFMGILAFLPETEKMPDRKFDAFGFILLSISIGAFQLMLDRGETQDWFASTEIIVEALIAGLCFYLFIIHLLTSSNPFFDPHIFKDRNYSVGLLFIFIIGIILLSSMTLLPPFLQSLMNYPVVLTGIVMAPRGLGTMCAMLLVGRVTGKIDSRILILCGVGATVYSLHTMSLFTTDVAQSTIIINGMIQGLGIGLVFAPLSTLAYATLAPSFRNDAAAIFSLGRNIGSSVGISVVTAFLARNIQVNHAELSYHLLSFGVQGNLVTQYTQRLQLDLPHRMALLNEEVSKQATLISYLDDFRLMMLIALLTLPLLLLIKKPVPKKNSALTQEKEIHTVLD